MNYRHWISVQQSESNKTLFMICESVVFERRGKASEHLLGIDEVNLVVFEIRAALRFIPSKPHIRIVYTPGASVKAKGEPSNDKVERRAVPEAPGCGTLSSRDSLQRLPKMLRAAARTDS